MKFTPASKLLSRMAMLAASSAMLPKVMVPMQISDTTSPVLPSRFRFIAVSSIPTAHEARVGRA